MAEPIEMPLGLWAWMVQRNHALDGSADPTIRRGNFGERGVHFKVSGVSCAKMAEPINLLFGLCTWVGRRHIGATWQIQLNHLSATVMRSYVKLL